MEQTGRIKTRCIGLKADENTAGWNTLITEGRALSVCRQIKTANWKKSDHNVGWNQAAASSRTVSVCRGTKILSVGTKWPQRVVLYRSAGKQKHFRLEPNGRNKCRSAGEHKTARWNKLDRTNETSYCFLLLSIITSQIKANKHRLDYYSSLKVKDGVLITPKSLQDPTFIFNKSLTPSVLNAITYILSLWRSEFTAFSSCIKPQWEGVTTTAAEWYIVLYVHKLGRISEGTDIV
jgi:hypothetical protein